ncbi:adenine phosphoribosyltransferase [candidate division TA06 bacterium DG_24]|uniref:Adenine phosphoribosyltransferase n=2 Tax=Bacteria division TA06 TaxID=1156500 RepID=A0A0S8G5R2_UNCT6|nr:MAG: adenine phosphoribosyltransferase [candidate division TA06 bacterium DG_24]KPK68293.1 MAG: adenine phosphoribosyltransferase [candidate division TA06 bacterium SM23_40]
MERLESLIRSIPDFPKKGILFRDITTLLKDPEGLRLAIDALLELFHDRDVDLVASIEARGLILGAPLAYLLGVGFVPVRKCGKLPARTAREEYELEYGTDAVEIHVDAIKTGQRVLVVDDLLATGGTALATCRVIEKLGGRIVGVAFLVELPDLGGREKLAGYDVESLVAFKGE